MDDRERTIRSVESAQESGSIELHARSTDSNDTEEYVVRRLTPTECARLQGFPDDWVWNIGIDNPTDEDIARWREIFYTYDMATKGTVKKRSDKVIAKFLKNPNSDSAEYKLWGNGIALPCIIPMMKAMYGCLTGE